MPLYVPTPTADIADAVWAYVARKLTSLSDPTDIVKFVGKGTGTELPNNKSLYDILLENLTGGGTPLPAGKSLYDLVALDRLDNATYGLNALRLRVLERLSKVDFDARIGDPTVFDPTANTIAGLLDSIINDIEESAGEYTMDGNEDTIAEYDAAAIDIWALPFESEAYIDLRNMQAGDTIVLKEYYELVTLTPPIGYALYDSIPYVGAQAKPVVHFSRKLGGSKWKITAQQTAGVNRTLYFRSLRTYRGIG